MFIKEITLTGPVQSANIYTPAETYTPFTPDTEYNERDRVSYVIDGVTYNYSAKNQFTSSTDFNEADWIKLPESAYAYTYLPNMYIEDNNKIYRCINEHYSAPSFGEDDPANWEEIGDSVESYTEWTELNTLLDSPLVDGSSYIITNCGNEAFNYIFTATEPDNELYGNVCADRSQIYWTQENGTMYVRLTYPTTYDLTALGLSKSHKIAKFTVEEVA